jgi:hypothetical protein
MKSSKEAGYLTVDSIAAFDAFIYMLFASPLALRFQGRDWMLGTSSLTMSKSKQAFLPHQSQYYFASHPLVDFSGTLTLG